MVQNPNQANLRSFVESKWISFQTWISGRFIIIQVISLISKSKLSLAFLFKFNEIIEVQCYFTVIQCIYDKHNYMIILCVYIWLQDEGVCISAYPFHRANTCCTKIIYAPVWNLHCILKHDWKPLFTLTHWLWAVLTRHVVTFLGW